MNRHPRSTWLMHTGSSYLLCKRRCKAVKPYGHAPHEISRELWPVARCAASKQIRVDKCRETARCDGDGVPPVRLSGDAYRRHHACTPAGCSGFERPHDRASVGLDTQLTQRDGRIVDESDSARVGESACVDEVAHGVPEGVPSVDANHVASRQRQAFRRAARLVAMLVAAGVPQLEQGPDPTSVLGHRLIGPTSDQAEPTRVAARRLAPCTSPPTEYTTAP